MKSGVEFFAGAKWIIAGASVYSSNKTVQWLLAGAPTSKQISKLMIINLRNINENHF